MKTTFNFKFLILGLKTAVWTAYWGCVLMLRVSRGECGTVARGQPHYLLFSLTENTLCTGILHLNLKNAVEILELHGCLDPLDPWWVLRRYHRPSWAWIISGTHLLQHLHNVTSINLGLDKWNSLKAWHFKCKQTGFSDNIGVSWVSLILNTRQAYKQTSIAGSMIEAASRGLLLFSLRSLQHSSPGHFKNLWPAILL